MEQRIFVYYEIKHKVGTSEEANRWTLKNKKMM